MDEICLYRRSYACPLRTSQLFMDLCSDQQLFTILFQFIGYSSYVQLTASSSKVHKTVSKHPHVEALVLKLKIKKLQDRENQRKYPSPLQIDFLLFNPYLLPPMASEELEPEVVLTPEQIEKQKSFMDFRSEKEADLIKNDWLQWRAKNRKNRLTAQKTNNRQIKSEEPPKNQSSAQNQVSMEQKMRYIEQAQQMLRLKEDLERKLIEEYPKTKNKAEEMKNLNFAKNILGKKAQKILMSQSDQPVQETTKLNPRSSSELRQKLEHAIPDNFNQKSNDVFSIRVKQLMLLEVQNLRHCRNQESFLRKGFRNVLECSGFWGFL